MSSAALVKKRAQALHLLRIPLLRSRPPSQPTVFPTAYAPTPFKVICIGLCKQENNFNASLTKTAGLEDKVIIPGEKSYFETGMPDSSCEVVCSQDALLLGGSQRHRAVAEAARVLKPGGRMVFTDVMRSDDATPKDLEEVSKDERPRRDRWVDGTINRSW